MEDEKAWVWFKGSLKGGYWAGGFIATQSNDGGYIIEKPDFVKCRVPEWRVTFLKPENEKEGPHIPEDPTWKYFD